MCLRFATLTCLTLLTIHWARPLAAQTPVSDTQFRGQPIDHWVERLRSGPVEELTLAGEEALPVWMKAVDDPKAVAWVRHALNLQLRDASWVGPIYIAMLDLPGPLNRNLAVGGLETRPDVAATVVMDIVNRARQWSKSNDDSEYDLVHPLVRVLNKLESPPSETIQLVVDLWPRFKDDTFLRRHLLELLAHNGPNSVAAVSEIFLKHQPEFRELQHYTKQVDVRTVLRIIVESRSKTPENRRLGAAMVASLTTSEKPPVDRTQIVHEIARLLEDDDLHVRRHALDGARNLKGDAAATELVPALERMLDSADSKSRHAAASALAYFGSRAIASIERASKSDNANTRVVASSAISSMDAIPAEGIDILLSLAKDENAKVRNYAVFSLGETKSSDPRVAEALINALDDPETEAWATRALGELGPSAESAVATLKAKLQTNDLTKRLQAATALWAITQDAEIILPIAKAIAGDDRGITSNAYSATYSNIGGKRVEQRKSYRYPLAARAAKLLGEMGDEAEPAVDELIKMLNHENREARWAALRAIGEIGPGAAKAISALEKLAEKEPSAQIRDVLSSIQNSP